MKTVLDRTTVTNPEAAEVFSSTRSREIIFALMEFDRSAQELHDLLRISLSLLNYHVKKLVRLGLVQVVGSRARAGRPILLYRSTAAAFLVPGALVKSSVGSKLRAELDTSLELANIARGFGDTLYQLDENGHPNMKRMPGKEGAKPAGERWWKLSLTDRYAKELIQEIEALMKEYAEKTEPHMQSYLCYFALARR